MELSFENPIILVGDGPINHDILKSLAHFPIIAIDGGANLLPQLGLEFEYICGDMDSVDHSVLDQTDASKIIRLNDQNACDFEKTLAIIEAPQIYAFGFLGGRMDHSVEALRLISAYKDKSIELIGVYDRAFVWPSGERRNVKIGQRLSLMAFGTSRIKMSSGLVYPIDDLEISPIYMSLSNEASEEKISISYEGVPLVAIIGLD